MPKPKNWKRVKNQEFDRLKSYLPPFDDILLWTDGNQNYVGIIKFGGMRNEGGTPYSDYAYDVFSVKKGDWSRVDDFIDEVYSWQKAEDLSYYHMRELSGKNTIEKKPKYNVYCPNNHWERKYYVKGKTIKRIKYARCPYCGHKLILENLQEEKKNES